METFFENVNKLIGTDMQLDLMKLLGINLHEIMQKNISEEARTAVANLLGSGVEGNWFYYIAPVCLLLLLLFWKKRRVTFAIPILIIMLIIMNPFAKEKFEKITETGYYWRLLWIIPIIPICAALPGMIEEKIKFQYTKGIIAILFAGLFVLLGSYTYDQRLARFSTPTNEAKIEQPFVDISDTLLTYDDHPYVVADAWPSVFIRQYTPKIRMLYGRDILGFGTQSGLGNQVYKQLNAGQYAEVASSMINDGYEYLVTNNLDEEKRNELRKAGFIFLNQIDVYGIYKIQGIPTALKKRNELGQIVSITCLNKYGLPVNGEKGYATISYTYDNDGHIIRELYLDLDGNIIANENGIAGYERGYDIKDRIITERTIDTNGKAIENSNGYAEVRREYLKDYIAKEIYYDANGNSTIRTDKGYSAIEYERNINGAILAERYFDKAGKATSCIYGYYGLTREYNGNNIVSETYYSEDGQMINQINGYSREDRIYDSNNHQISQLFYDSNNTPVIVYTGYAEVVRTFDEEGRLTFEKYYGVDKQPLRQPAGHTAIEQKYDEDGNLLTRKYLDSEGNLLTRVDGYVEAKWSHIEANEPSKVYFLDAEGLELHNNHINLVKDIHTDSEGWSKWMIPIPNTPNQCFYIGTINLGEKQEGDLYTCQVEIEFQNVTCTEDHNWRMLAQGPQDGKWFTGNVWNRGLLDLYEPPQDGIYTMVSTQKVSGEMLDVSTFSIGFRCDYWKSGMFRVRKVKVEKGDYATEWTPGI